MMIRSRTLSLALLSLMMVVSVPAPAVAAPGVTATITVGNRPISVAFSPNGKKAYVTNYGGDEAVDEGFGILADDTIIDAVGLNNFYLWNDAGVTVPAGDTINFVYFYSSIGSLENGSPAPFSVTDLEFNAVMEGNFGDPATVLANTRLMEGIVGGAYNWGATPEDDSEEDDSEELAETGRVDASGIAFGGALALAAGVGVYALRRRGARA